MFNMKNKFKKIFEFLSCLSAILCLMSCLNSVSSSGSSGKDNQPDESTTVIFKGSINIESSLVKSLLRSNYSLSNSRSASPEAIDMASHEFYVFATSKAGVTQEVEVQEDAVTGSVTFEVPLEFGEWTIETGIRKSANEQKILVDIFTVKLLTNTPTFSHAFYLKPVSEGMGSINLEMYVPDSITKMLIKVDSQPDGADFDSTECTADGEAPDRKIILSRTEVPAGTYNLVFTYYNSANNPQFSTIQTVNVLAGLETSKWVSGSTSTLISDGFFAVTDDLIEAWRNQRSHYYVDSETGSDSNAGGPLDPYETLSHAVSIINDIYGDETKEVTISMNAGSTETLTSAITISDNKTVTLKSEGSGTAATLLRGTSFTGAFISIPSSSSLTMEGLIINGGNIAGAGNVGINNAGTFIMNSGKICGNNNTNTNEGAGVYNAGTCKINGGEISGNKCAGTKDTNNLLQTGAGIHLNGTDITISGGKIKNNTLSNGTTAANLFLPSGKKIKVEKAITSGTEINITLGWIPKNVTADTAAFTTGYGPTNNTANPSDYFKSDLKYVIMAIPSSSNMEAAIALNGKAFENVYQSYKMTFAVNTDKFQRGDDSVENRTIKVTPTIIFNNEDITSTLPADAIKWKLTLLYRGIPVENHTSTTNELVINASYTGRYDLHVYADYMGLRKDAEFVITGYNSIININGENKVTKLQNLLNSITEGAPITKDTCINLTEDINLTVEDYFPVGAAIENGKKIYKNTNFEGTFDGNGNTITISDVKAIDYFAICYCNKGIIQNVVIEVTKPSITLHENYDSTSSAIYDAGNTNYKRYGGICDVNEGIIRNCWTKADVDGIFFGYIGGICCVNHGLIENCVNESNFGKTQQMEWGFSYSWKGQYGEAGGITGRNADNGIIRNCVNYGIVNLKKKADSSSCLNGSSGAICGAQTAGTSEVSYCYSIKNCVWQAGDSNRVVHAPSSYSKNGVTNGKFIANGYFESKSDGSLTASPSVTGPSQPWPQTLRTDSNNDLVTALNAYVNEVDPNHSYLKEWEAGNGYAAVFKE